VAWRFVGPGSGVGSGARKIEYILRIDGVRPFTVPLYEIGMRVFDKRTDDFIGVIKEIHVEEFLSTHNRLDGSVHRVLRPHQVTIYLTVEADGRETGSAFYASSSFKLKLDSTIQIVTKKMDVRAVIAGIEGVEHTIRNNPYTGSFERP
jgi:hypothetical protein